MYLECGYCQYRKDILGDFEQGMITVRYLIQLMAKGCDNCRDSQGSELRIKIEGKKKEIIDTKYEEWQVRDWIKWADQEESGIFRIKMIKDYRVYWDDPKTGEENMTRDINLVRVTGYENE